MWFLAAKLVVPVAKLAAQLPVDIPALDLLLHFQDSENMDIANHFQNLARFRAQTPQSAGNVENK
jgi:hypothetical protein